MEMFKIGSPLALSMSLFIAFALAAAAVAAGGEGQQATATSADRASPEGYDGHFQYSSAPSLRRVARALSGFGEGGHNSRWPPTPMTCGNHPKVCGAPGSPGPDCCGKRCVNTKTDNLNCGWCGMRCWYGSMCCRGRCVGLMYDRDNCGRCGNRCKKGSYCNYGMCSYGY